MQTLDQIIANRRSVRCFDAEKGVEEAQLRAAIAAAIEAPTWKNSQTGRFYVAMGDDARGKVVESLPDFNRKSVEGAKAFVVTSFKHNRSGYERSGEPTNEIGNGWGCYDLGLQTAYFLLKATEMGLDTLVLGIRDAEALAAAFDIPSDETVVSVIAVGHRANEPMRPKRKEVDEVAKFF